MSVLCGACNHIVDSPDDAICVNCCRKNYKTLKVVP